VWDKGYRYGFNGKEIDKGDEGMGGGGSTYDYGFRIYNPSLGKFLSVDPLTASYPWYTPYQFAGNMPINCIDLDGLEEYKVVSFFNSITGKTTSQMELINADVPFKVVYYSANMAVDCNIPAVPDGYIEKLISTNTTDFNTVAEFEKALYLYNSLLNDRSTSDLNVTHVTCFVFNNNPIKLPIPTPEKTNEDKPNPIPFKGEMLKLKTTIKVSDYSLGWFSTSPLPAGSKDGDGNPAVSGELTKEGKKILTKLANSINSMSTSPKSITLISTGTVGTSVTDTQKSYADKTLKLISDKASNYLKSKIKNKNIKINSESIVTKSDSSSGNGVKLKID
jgi:RHS repeat-associated protein